MDTSAESDKQLEKEKTATAEPSIETAETKPEKNRSKQPRARKPKQGGRRPRRNTFTGKQVADRFAACGRCSYFWAGYKVLCGEDAQETAVAEGAAGWLELTWHPEMPRLLYKSYGVRLDIEHFHYEGCCKECRRRFVCRAAENEAALSSCAIEISPHRAD